MASKAQTYNAQWVPILAPRGFDPAHGLTGAVDSAAFERSVKAVQRLLGVKADGMCGPGTIMTLQADLYERHERRGLMCGPRIIALPDGVQCVTWRDRKIGAWLGKTPSRARREPLRQGVIHYDVTNSSQRTEEVLLGRGYSTHLLINHDGVIYQSHDLATRVCFHAGTEANSQSIGLDLNNPALRKYERGPRHREQADVVVHGQRVKLLRYWPEQLVALRAVVVACEDGLGLPARYPDKLSVLEQPLEWAGWIGHLHLTRNKMDPTPLTARDVMGGW